MTSERQKSKIDMIDMIEIENNDDDDQLKVVGSQIVVE